MLTQPLIIAALLLIFGLLGSRWIARHFRGLRAIASYLCLCVVPYGGVLLCIGAASDPTLSPRQSLYDAQLAFALFVIAFTLPWLLACAIGAWLGRRGYRRQPVADWRNAAPLQAFPTAGDLPDWHNADNPKLTLGALDAQIRSVAAQHGFAAERLPDCHSPSQGEGTFIDLEKFDYIYGYFERGQLSWSHPSVIADEICYRVFYDLAFADATAMRALAPDPALAYLTQVRRDHEAILARIDPRWATQAVYDRATREKAGR